MFERGTRSDRPIDRLRPGLLHVILSSLRGFNANTRLLLRLLEEPDWSDLRARTLAQLRKRLVH